MAQAGLHLSYLAQAEWLVSLATLFGLLAFLSRMSDQLLLDLALETH